MSQRPHGQAPPSEMGDPNYAALLFQQQADGSTRQIGAASGGWEQQADGRSQLQQDSPVLPWLENTVQGGQRRRVLPPNSAAAAASNPFLDVCSGESNFQWASLTVVQYIHYCFPNFLLLLWKP